MQFIKCFILAIVLLFVTNIGEAQKNTEFDTVHLKNGEKVIGVIIEVFHDNYVDIVRDKEKIRILYNQVQSIEYSEIANENPRYKKKIRNQQAYNLPGKKIYYNFLIDLHMGKGQNQWVEPGRGFTFSAGYRFNRKVIVGAGFGYDSYRFNLNGGIIPVFLEYRYEFLERSFTPFATMRAGYGNPIAGGGNWNGAPTSKIGGLYFNPMMGIRLRSQRKGQFQFGIGYKFQDYTEYGIQFNNGPNGQWLESTYVDKLKFNRIAINASLMF